MDKIFANKISQTFHELYQQGLTTSSGGNISCKDELGLIHISPSQIDKGYLKDSDICVLGQDGKSSNENKPSMEYPFHLSIYKKFPQIKCIVHIHPPVIVALSLLTKNQPDLKHLTEKNKIVLADYALPGSDSLGEKICEVFNDAAQIVLMQNHGVIAIGNDLGEVVKRIMKFTEVAISHFKLNSLLNAFTLKGRFEVDFENDVRFFEKRTKHFLCIKNEVVFSQQPNTNLHYSAIHLISLALLSQADFSSHVIPESYLILKNPLLKDEVYDPSKIEKYLKCFSNQLGVIIFRDGWTLISGTSYYNLYDKMEVLNFTTKVILMAQKMGNYNLLSDTQIQELKENFSILKIPQLNPPD